MPTLSQGTELFLAKNINLFYRVAQVGFAASLIVHLSTFFGLRATLDYFWFLHVGLFVVLIPALALTNYNQPETSKSKIFNFGMEKSPGWLKLACIIFLIYAGINLILFLTAMGGGGPDFIGGKYVASSHGQIVREITESEYWHLKILEARGFSGHWMVFYLVATSILHTQKIK